MAHPRAKTVGVLGRGGDTEVTGDFRGSAPSSTFSIHLPHPLLCRYIEAPWHFSDDHMILGGQRVVDSRQTLETGTCTRRWPPGKGHSAEAGHCTAAKEDPSAEIGGNHVIYPKQKGAIFVLTLYGP